MIGIEFGSNAAIYLTAFIFGIGYNAAINYAKSRHWLHGHLYAAVAGGVSVTLFFVWLIHPQSAFLALGMFVATGLPMAVGAMYRTAIERERELNDAKEEMASRSRLG